MLYTALCSLLLSIDDYLSVLTTGSAMTPINDRYKTPREMTSYIVDSTAAPACVINPISTWAVFIGGLMVANGLGEPGTQVLTYVKVLPYNFYAIGALLVLFLVIIGVIPKFGPMKKAFERVEAGGPLAPPGSERIDIRAGKEQEIPENPRLRNFFVPMLVLVGATIFFGFDMQMGVVTAIGFNFIWFVLQGMSPETYVDEVLRGLKNMLMPLFMMVLAFSFADGCERIGFMDYVVNVATEHITLQYLPITIFLVFAFTEFIMGINWGMYIIALPMVVPVTLALGGDPIVMVGVVAAAGVWGSHCCFYSDATILTSAATGCDNFRHAITQIPLRVHCRHHRRHWIPVHGHHPLLVSHIKPNQERIAERRFASFLLFFVFFLVLKREFFGGVKIILSNPFPSE
jgi:Na+/H+ antiporter